MSKRIMTKRMTLFMAAFFCLLVLLVGRLFYLQIIAGPELKKKAVEQQTKDTIVSPKRGTIYDRNGKVLAVSVTAESVIIDPMMIAKNKKISGEEIARALSEILEMDYEAVLEKVNKTKTNYQEVKLRIDKDMADKIRELDYAGVTLKEDTKREYIYGSLASHVIGFCGRDNQGLQGLEMVYDKELKGINGRIEAAKNAAGTDMPYKYERYVDPVDGQNLVLTIDEAIQHFAEKYINEAVDLYGLKEGAAAIVMNPNTGDIYAMAVAPGYDLNAPFTLVREGEQEAIDALPDEEKTKAKSDALNKMWRNKAVVDTYEPGSVFKMITTASALEEGVVTVNNTFNCPGGVHIGPDYVKCWRYYNPHGVQDLRKGLMNSCNCVFMALGEKLGAEKFEKYYKAFGFTESTHFELPGEANGFWHTSYKPIDLAVSSFGQSFQITPLQMICAASSIVNGGKIVKPHLVKQITDAEGNVVKNVETEIVRQVISEETSETMRSLLESVVEGGTGSNAYIKGYRIGGKTGTSEKLPRGSGKKIASFMGVAPCNDPQVVVLVMLDEPTPDGTHTGQGGQIAAPTAGKILEDTLRCLGIEPQLTQDELMKMDIVVPNVENTAISEAKKTIEGLSLKVKIVGDGETVVSQVPKGSSTLQEGSTVILYTTEQTMSKVTVPSLIGYTVNDAKASAKANGLNFQVSGVGANNSVGDAKVVLQTPQAGETVPQGTVIYVEARQQDVH